MNGSEHYRAAERLLAMERDYPSARDREIAQVHATLALAAATALPFLPDLCGFTDSSPAEVWREVIS